jgi:hypothetical protein
MYLIYQLLSDGKTYLYETAFDCSSPAIAKRKFFAMRKELGRPIAKGMKKYYNVKHVTKEFAEKALN